MSTNGCAVCPMPKIEFVDDLPINATFINAARFGQKDAPVWRKIMGTKPSGRAKCVKAGDGWAKGELSGPFMHDHAVIRVPEPVEIPKFVTRRVKVPVLGRDPKNKRCDFALSLSIPDCDVPSPTLVIEASILMDSTVFVNIRSGDRRGGFLTPQQAREAAGYLMALADLVEAE